MQVKHSLTNGLQHPLQKCRTVDTGGQQAFVTEGTAKEAIRLQFPHRSSMKLNSVQATRYSLRNKNCVLPLLSPPLRPFHAFLTFSSSFSSVSVVNSLKAKESNKKNGKLRISYFLEHNVQVQTKTLPWLPVQRNGGRIPCLTNAVCWSNGYEFSTQPADVSYRLLQHYTVLHEDCTKAEFISLICTELLRTVSDYLWQSIKFYGF